MPATQLLDIEEKSPHLKPCTNKIWMKVVKREFPKHVLDAHLKNHKLYDLYLKDQNEESVESVYADSEDEELGIEIDFKQKARIDYRELYHELTHEMEIKLQSASERLRKSMKKVQTERLTNAIVEINMDPATQKKRLDVGRKLMSNPNSPIGSSRSLEKSWKNTLTKAIQMSRCTNPSSGYAKISSKANPYANQFRKTTNTIINSKPTASINVPSISRPPIPSYNASSPGLSFPREVRVTKTGSEKETFKPTSSLKRKISQDETKSKGTAKKIFSLGSTPVSAKSSKQKSSSSFVSNLASINSKKSNESLSKISSPKLLVNTDIHESQPTQISPKLHQSSPASNNILSNEKRHAVAAASRSPPPSSASLFKTSQTPLSSSLSRSLSPPLLKSSPSPPSSCHSSSSLSPPKTFQSIVACDSSPTKSSSDSFQLGTDSSTNSTVADPTLPVSPQSPHASINPTNALPVLSQNTSSTAIRPIGPNSRTKPLRRPVSIFIRPKKRI